MRIISFKKIREFIEKDPESDVAMREWHKKTEDADWKNSKDALPRGITKLDHVFVEEPENK